MRHPLVIVAFCAALGFPAAARADGRLHFSGFFGVRTSSEVARLGTPTTTSISSSVGLGPRVHVRLFKRWVAEAELGLFPSSTRVGDVSVVVFDPRAQLVFELPEQGHFQPMVLAGFGGPLALSANSAVLDTDLQYEGYAGAAVRFSRGGGLSFRLDVRIHGGPARQGSNVALGSEVLVGISYRPKSRTERGLAPLAKDIDTDNDGIVDSKDQCKTRPEDKDGYKDDDGCPDIDDDLDGVLDVADKCRRQPETYNGYKDDDGCPDTLPDDLSAITGVLENVVFHPASTRLYHRARRPLRKLAAVLKKYPNVRIILIGHTDNKGDADAKLLLSKTRAEVVRKLLVAMGIDGSRITTVGRGGAQPLFDNETRRNRFKNNRIELKLYQRRKE